MAGDTWCLTLRGIDGSTSGTLRVAATDSLLPHALRLREGRGGHGTKCPQLLCGGECVPLQLSVAAAGLRDAAELTIVWPTAVKRPFAGRASVGYVPKRPALGDRELALIVAGDHAVNLSGIAIGEPQAHTLAVLPPSLASLDVRNCRLRPTGLQAIFMALPAGVMELRASGNAITKSALASLARPDLQLRVLDVGKPEFPPDLEEDSDDEPDMDCVTALLGAHTEELRLQEMCCVSPAGLGQIASRCPNLCTLDISFASNRAWYEEEQVCEAWYALSSCCPKLRELQACSTPCSEQSRQLLCSSCPSLDVVVIGHSPMVSSASPPLDGARVEALHCICETIDEALRLTRLDVGWLSIDFKLDPNDESEACILLSHQCLVGSASGSEFAQALASSTASDFELRLPFFHPAVLCAAGLRLRAVESTYDTAGPYLTGVLSPLASALKSQPFWNLLALEVDYYEQIVAEELAVVASSCPLLETVKLNADEYGFQREAIDEGVLALGSHCRYLRHLDLYDRSMRDAASVLALACKGWPQLRYLCAAGTLPPEMGWDHDDNKVLARALAEHCPVLEELVLYPVPSSWRAILAAACPLLDWQPSLPCSEECDGDDAGWVMPGEV